MAGLGIVISRTGPGTGPIIPTPLHGNGVAGATHRYVPERLALATGAEISSVPDLIGTANLALVAGAGSTPVVAETSGQKYLEFVAGATARTLAGTADMGAAFSWATVLRATDKSIMNLVVDGYRTGVVGNDSWALYGYTGSATGYSIGVARSGDFVVVFGVGAGTDSRLGVNAAITANAGTVTGPAPSDADRLQWGSGPFAVTAGTKQDIVEQNIWPFVLTADQRAAHIAAMKAKWTALLTT